MDLFGWAAYSSQDSATSRHVQPSASSSTPAMSIDDPWPPVPSSKDPTPTGPVTASSSSSNPPASSLDLSDFTAFDDIASSNPASTSAMLSPSNPYMHPFANYFVGYPYSAPWPVPVAQANVPLSSYSTLNGATSVGSSSSASAMAQSSSSQSQQQPASAPQAQGHAQPQQQAHTQPQHSPPLQHATVASPMIVDNSLSVNGGSSSSNGSAFHSNSYPASGTSPPSHPQYSYQTIALSPYTTPYYRQPPPTTSSSSSNQAQGQGTLSPHALHSSAGSPTNSTSSSYMFSPTTGIHPGLFYGLPPTGPTGVPVSASSSSSSTPSGTSTTPSSAPTPQIQHTHPSQQQFQQQYHQFQLQQHQQQQQQYQQQLQQQQQKQDAAAREAAAQEKEKERRENFEKSVRPLLQTNAFSGAAGVRDLVDKIVDFGAEKVDPSLRLEILQKMRDGAPNHYFRAWSENPDAMDVTKEWLKTAALVKDGSASKGDSDTVMPLLHVLDRLPLTLDILKTSRIGKIVRNLVKQSPSPAIKDMASNLERRWLDLVQKAKANESGATTSGPNPNQSSGTEAVSKKRKEPPSVSSASTSNSKGSASGSAPPSKKPAVGTSTSTKPIVKKESSSSKPLSASSSSASATKGAGTDTSFFSAPKPKAAKAKLPSFKKAPIPPPVKSSTPNGEGGDDVAMPSAVDPFAEIVKSMKLKKEPLSYSPSNVQPASSSNIAAKGSAGGIAGGKGGKRKSVTWAQGADLTQVKLIERAVYDDDMKDGTHGTSLRDLDRGEGAALHQQGLEEAIDWSDPLALLLTEETDQPRGGKSEEKEVQEAREATALGALYMTDAQIPDTPSEPSQVMPEEEVDKNVVMMTLGPENEHLTWDAEAMAAAPESGPGPMNVDPLAAAAALTSQPAVAQLLQKLAMDPSMLAQAVPQPAPVPAATESFAGATLQHLIQQLQTTTPGSVPPPAGFNGGPGYDAGPPPGGAWPGHHAPSDYDHADYPGSASGPGNWNDRRGRGRGGRGSGSRGERGRGGDGHRNNRRIPCTFFAEGRCKYGDHCNFAHEQAF